MPKNPGKTRKYLGFPGYFRVLPALDAGDRRGSLPGLPYCCSAGLTLATVVGEPHCCSVVTVNTSNTVQLLTFDSSSGEARRGGAGTRPASGAGAGRAPKGGGSLGELTRGRAERGGSKARPSGLSDAPPPAAAATASPALSRSCRVMASAGAPSPQKSGGPGCSHPTTDHCQSQRASESGSRGSCWASSSPSSPRAPSSGPGTRSPDRAHGAPRA